MADKNESFKTKGAMIAALGVLEIMVWNSGLLSLENGTEVGKWTFSPASRTWEAHYNLHIEQRAQASITRMWNSGYGLHDIIGALIGAGYNELDAEQWTYKQVELLDTRAKRPLSI